MQGKNDKRVKKEQKRKRRTFCQLIILSRSRILIIMASFVNTQNPTPYGFYDSDLVFQSDADSIILFVKRLLGDDVVSVALPSKAIWANFEHATSEFSRIINEHQIESNMDNILGMPTGSDIQGKYPRETLNYLYRQSEPYAMEAGLSGFQEHVSGSIVLTASQQDYDLYEDLKLDGTSTSLFDTQETGKKSGMRVMEVLHYSPMAAYRFFDSTSAINYLNNEFSFESFTPETIFYVLPVFEDLLRAGQMQLSQRVRRSNYSYKLRGRHIRIFPMPTGSTPKKLWVRVMFNPDGYDPGYTDDTITGISNISNVPYTDLTYANINTWGRTWIRKFTLANCKETLGHIRGKYSSGIPIPSGEVQLNYADLLAHSREDKASLVETIKESLEKLTSDALIERDATRAENIMKQLRMIPFSSPIVPG